MIIDEYCNSLYDINTNDWKDTVHEEDDLIILQNETWRKDYKFIYIDESGFNEHVA